MRRKKLVKNNGEVIIRKWTKEQRLQAVSTYLILGNMAQTAIATEIPLQTLKMWKATEWFKDYMLKLQAEDLQEMDSKMRGIVNKSLKALENRLDLGDAQFDPKTGDIIRIPVKAKVALNISTELMTKRQKLAERPHREEHERTVEDRLLKLAEEFSRFAQNKAKALDITDVVIAPATPPQITQQ